MFEYKVENCKFVNSVLECFLNRMAADRWELCETIHDADDYPTQLTLIFRRWKKQSDLPICDHCGYSLSPDFVWCPKCGDKLSKKEPVKS